MDERISKPNRRAKQEEKAHSQVIHKPMGLPEWTREKTRKQRNFERAQVTKRARK